MDLVDAEDLIDARTRMRVHLAEQDSTDLEKALRHIRAPAILGFGFLGKRLDHSLAALSVLARYAHQHRVILVSSDDVLHITSGRFKMAMKTGDRLSIWPIGQVDFAALLVCTGRWTGWRWHLINRSVPLIRQPQKSWKYSPPMAGSLPMLS